MRPLRILEARHALPLSALRQALFDLQSKKAARRRPLFVTEARVGDLGRQISSPTADRDENEARQARVLTHDEARRIAAEHCQAARATRTGARRQGMTQRCP